MRLREIREFWQKKSTAATTQDIAIMTTATSLHSATTLTANKTVAIAHLITNTSITIAIAQFVTNASIVIAIAITIAIAIAIAQ